ncbi:MAG TPA: hypothetical protein VGH98_08605 [Gemmatimonadaceae bacterium]|jgi:hypothetical protein
MTVALTLWIATVLIILGSLVFSSLFQMHAHRVAVKHQVELRQKLDEQQAEMAFNFTPRGID